jgi:hypothetical protein
VSGDAGERLSFLDRALPAAFRRRVLGLAPGSERRFLESEWRDALVVVERGVLELECLAGDRRRFGPGDVLCLAGLPLRALRQRGPDPLVLVAVSRRSPDGGDTYPRASRS